MSPNASVTRPSPEENLRQDRVKRLRKFLKLRQGVFKVVWRQFVIWTYLIQVLKTENTIDLWKGAEIQISEFFHRRITSWAVLGILENSNDQSSCWGPSASEGPQKRDLTMFSKWNMWTGIFGFGSWVYRAWSGQSLSETKGDYDEGQGDHQAVSY
jgi:hypothetical protein